MALQKPREFALNALCRAEEDAAHIEAVLAETLSGRSLAPVDRSLAQELTYGAVRWRSTLDWLIAGKARQIPHHRALRWILRLGLYQLFWLDRIPDHAAINESVALARAKGLSSQSGFVNAILRGYQREREETRHKLEALKTSDPALGYSHPAWLCERWKERWGPKVLGQLLEWNNTPARVYARCNRLRTTPDALAALWAREGVEAEPVSFDWIEPGLAFDIRTGINVTQLESFRQGGFYLQDPSTLLAVSLLDPKPGEAVLDTCAAPGGKTTYMAQRMENRGQIMAQDLDIHRRNLIKENCLRLGVRMVTISRATTQINEDLSEPFDAVLVDAPCSNTGVMRRRVDLRWHLKEGVMAEMADRQLALLRSAQSQVRPGGRLAYSTCSLEPEENEQVVSRFLKEAPSFELVTQRTLLPWQDGVDGAYVALMRSTS